MPHYLLTGAGFTRNWGGPLSSEVGGSLLGDLQDYPELTAILRKQPFEDAFQGFASGNKQTAAQKAFQDAVVNLFTRLNKALLGATFEFRNPPDVGTRVMDFLAKFDALFTLNQDLLIEEHYIRYFGAKQGKWSGVVIPGMQAISHDAPQFGALNQTWEPTGNFTWPDTMQPYFKLHGSTNWSAGRGQPILVMGNQKSGAVDEFPVLRQSHEFFASALKKPNARLMVVGYSFQDKHINDVIESARGLGIHIVDPSGSDVLKDPSTRNAPIKVRRSIEDIKLIGELRRPLHSIFSGQDSYAHGELMRFFS